MPVSASNPVTSGPVVNESLETSIPECLPAVMSCTSMTSWTMYPKKPASPERMPQNISSAGAIMLIGKEIPIVATDGVRYTVPKTLHVANMDDELTVRFRVGGVYKNCYISTYLNDQRIICRKRPVMAPGEMATGKAAEVRSGSNE